MSMSIPAFVVCCLMSCLADITSSQKPPLELEHRGYVRDKWTSHAFRLTLSNPGDKPIWFILPKGGNKALPQNNVFKNNEKQPFGAVRWEGEGGSVVEVTMVRHFYAFRLPARGRVEIPDYTLSTSRGNEDHFRAVEVLAADELKINGKTPLEEWLPFRSMCDKSVKLVEHKGYTTGLHWKAEAGRRKDYPAEKVEYVEALGARRWKVTFEPKGKISRQPYPLRNRVHLPAN